MAGGGGSGVNDSGATQAAIVSALRSGKIFPVKGTEAYPIDIQAVALVMQKNHSPKQFEEDMKLVDSMATQRTEQEIEEKITIKDFSDIFIGIEKEQGFEAARHYATIGINYDRLTAIAKRFTDGIDSNPDNDPNIMPTRFILLYGMDDAKIKTIDKLPDNFENASEHKITIANLRKGLLLLGSKISETGPYDDELWRAHAQYINRRMETQIESAKTHTVDTTETLGSIARKYGLPTWKYLYEINKKRIGDNPAFLEKGVELEIPQWDRTSGDEKLVAKGVEPADYAHGSRYYYPWVPFNATLNADGQEKPRSKSDSSKSRKFELRNKENGSLLAIGELNSENQINAIIPDSHGMEITVDGWTCDIG
jgi:LysM repeat protein